MTERHTVALNITLYSIYSETVRIYQLKFLEYFTITCVIVVKQQTWQRINEPARKLRELIILLHQKGKKISQTLKVLRDTAGSIISYILNALYSSKATGAWKKEQHFSKRNLTFEQNSWGKKNKTFYRQRLAVWPDKARNTPLHSWLNITLEMNLNMQKWVCTCNEFYGVMKLNGNCLKPWISTMSGVRKARLIAKRSPSRRWVGPVGQMFCCQWKWQSWPCVCEIPGLIEEEWDSFSG